MACWIDWNGDGNLGDNNNKFINNGGMPPVNVTIPDDGSYALGRASVRSLPVVPHGRSHRWHP